MGQRRKTGPNKPKVFMRSRRLKNADDTRPVIGAGAHSLSRPRRKPVSGRNGVSHPSCPNGDSTPARSKLDCANGKGTHSD